MIINKPGPNRNLSTN